MRAGDLKQKVRIEYPTDARDSGGGFTRTWAVLDTLPAAITSESAGEPVSADALSSTATHLVRVRYRTGITASMRAVHAGRYFRILSVVDPDQGKRELHLACVEKVDDEAA